MAGHSKWANIKHKKERADAKKGKVFSRCAKEIISAVKMGGPDKTGNPRLRLAIEKAKENNVPNDIIDRNVKKASATDQADYTDVTYELYGHGGVGIIVEGMTDNKNRMASEMRIATNKRGGNIATPGAVTFNFDQKGIIQILAEDVKEDALFLAATEAGAEGFEKDEDVFIITTDPTDLMAVKDVIREKGFKVDSAELTMIPKVFVDVSEEDQTSNQGLIDWLEDLEDVDSVWHNMSVS